MDWDPPPLAALREEAGVPGAAVGIIVPEGRWTWCDGVTSVRDPQLVDEQTLFQLGSVTKVVTATAAMALVDRGIFRLADLVADRLPDIDFGPAGDTLTVEHLLSHRGGWQGDWSLFN